jgi:hypothetical protein
MLVHVGDLPTESTLLQQVRHQELSAVSSEELTKKIRALQASAWESHSLRWHFGKHGSQIGAFTETEYAKSSEDVLSNPTRIFSEIYIDMLTAHQYGLGHLLPREREKKIKQIVASLPRSWIFVDERTGRVVVVSDIWRILTLYAHTVPDGIATFIRNRLLPEGIEVVVQGEVGEEDQDA